MPYLVVLLIAARSRGRRWCTSSSGEAPAAGPRSRSARSLLLVRERIREPLLGVPDRLRWGDRCWDSRAILVFDASPLTARRATFGACLLAGIARLAGRPRHRLLGRRRRRAPARPTSAAMASVTGVFPAAIYGAWYLLRASRHRSPRGAVRPRQPWGHAAVHRHGVGRARTGPIAGVGPDLGRIVLIVAILARHSRRCGDGRSRSRRARSPASVAIAAFYALIGLARSSIGVGRGDLTRYTYVSTVLAVDRPVCPDRAADDRAA